MSGALPLEIVRFPITPAPPHFGLPFLQTHILDIQYRPQLFPISSPSLRGHHVVVEQRILRDHLLTITPVPSTPCFLHTRASLRFKNVCLAVIASLVQTVEHWASSTSTIVYSSRTIFLTNIPALLQHQRLPSLRS